MKRWRETVDVCGRPKEQLVEARVTDIRLELRTRRTEDSDAGELGTAAIEALEAADSPVIVEHREALMAADHSDHTLFVHGLRTLIASWDPSIG